MTLKPGHLPEEQRKILRTVALAYRRVMRAPLEPAVTRAEISRRDQKRQSEALAAATAEYRRLSPGATGDKLTVSGEVNRMIAAALMPIPGGSGRGRRRELPSMVIGYREGTKIEPDPARGLPVRREN